MRRSNFTTRGQDGTTVIEVMVVVLIISVLAAWAIMNRGSANEQFKRQNAAIELKVAFERARFDSVKRRATGGPAQVTVTPTSFTLRTYNNGVAKDETTTLPAGIVIGNYDDSALTSKVISFDQRGEVPVAPSPQFFVCDVAQCTTTTPAVEKNILIVTPTGTVNFLAGSATLPSFGIPTMTNVSTSGGINPDTIVPTPTP